MNTLLVTRLTLRDFRNIQSLSITAPNMIWLTSGATLTINPTNNLTPGVDFLGGAFLQDGGECACDGGGIHALIPRHKLA